jgi:hypothetical protein
VFLAFAVVEFEYASSFEYAGVCKSEFLNGVRY